MPRKNQSKAKRNVRRKEAPVKRNPKKLVVGIAVIAVGILFIASAFGAFKDGKYTGSSELGIDIVDIDVLGSNKGFYVGQTVDTQGYIVKFESDGETVYEIHSAREIAGNVKIAGIELEGGFLDPFSSYIWNDDAYTMLEDNEVVVTGEVRQRNSESIIPEFYMTVESIVRAGK